jgi:hypothetical protein
MRIIALLTVVLVGCSQEKKAAAGSPPADSGGAPDRFDRLSRVAFNQAAQALFVPLFWRTDANGDGALQPEELVVLWGPQLASRADFVSPTGAFTPRFRQLYALMQRTPDFSGLPPEEKARREAVLKELEQGAPTLVESDFSKSSAQDQAVVGHLVDAAVALERLYARQLGTLALKESVPQDDRASQALFHRNQGPGCVAPLTENNPACTALAGTSKAPVGLYPAEVQASPTFCDALSKAKNAKQLMDHFSTVVADGKGFKAMPFSQAFADDMEVVAKALEAAATAIVSDDEKAFKSYLLAAAKAFRTNDWETANVAWAAMNATNSKWYLRIAPDEVYFEPCNWKAGFALNLSRINLDSLAWQQKLEPVKGQMEESLAALAGAPYKARQVAFKLPDFIDVVLNAGDQRNPHGATIGQSLPNWGAVAAKGGRTVTMTNLYTDADSRATLERQMKSLFCPATAALATTDPKPAVMSVVLHEAAHNLGPSHEYKVKGKDDDEVFGGPLASMMEELKAQTSALYFSEWLATKGLISADEAKAAHVRDVAWAFGHISRGMYDGSTPPRPKTYSHVAGIQLGALSKAGVVTFMPEVRAANGEDVGCFEVNLEAWPAAVDGLAKRVLMAKGRGDKTDAQKMVAEFIDAKDGWAQARTLITERWLRAPKATFVYAITR